MNLIATSWTLTECCGRGLTNVGQRAILVIGSEKQAQSVWGPGVAANDQVSRVPVLDLDPRAPPVAVWLRRSFGHHSLNAKVARPLHAFRKMVNASPSAVHTFFQVPARRLRTLASCEPLTDVGASPQGPRPPPRSHTPANDAPCAQGHEIPPEQPGFRLCSLIPN
jgi:hypothetical protein